MNRFFLLSFISFVLVSCKQETNTSSSVDTNANDSSLTEKEIFGHKDNCQEEILFQQAYENALKFSENQLNKDEFNHNSQEYLYRCPLQMKVHVEYGNLFSTNQKHLIIKRKLEWETRVNIYSVKNKKLSDIFEKKYVGTTSYLSDSVMDVNGDNIKDFVVLSYPSSGCCLANINEINLYNHLSDNFQESITVLNPTYSPKEKIIRGLEYGHPGETGIYKFRWINNYKLDTLEYIYPFYRKGGFYIKTKKPDYRPQEKNGTVLTALPFEYSQILGIEWFLDDLEK